MLNMNVEEKVCETLIDMMEEMPFEKIHVTGLADRAGISRSTFYVYYESTYDVLQHVEEMVIDEFIADPVPADIGRRQLMEISSGLQEKIRFFNVLTGPNGSPSFYAKLAARNRKTLLRVAEELHSSATATELQVINEFTLAGKIRIFQWWAEHEQYVSVSEMAAILDRLNRCVNEMLLAPR